MTKVCVGAWLTVAAAGVWSATVDQGDDWEIAYSVFLVGLLVGAGTSVAVAAGISGTTQPFRPRLRTAGLWIAGAGAALAYVAWAIPVWTTMLGVGLALVAAATAAENRRRLLVMAAACPAGLITLVIGIEAELGRRDEWGDYPVASGLAIALTAVLMVAGVLIPTTPRAASLRSP